MTTRRNDTARRVRAGRRGRREHDKHAVGQQRDRHHTTMTQVALAETLYGRQVTRHARR